MSDTKNSKVSVDILTLSTNTEKIVGKMHSLMAELSQLKDSVAKLDELWSGNAADGLKAELTSEISEIELFIQAGKQAAREYDFALSTYKENEQKSMDIIGAIVV